MKKITILLNLLFFFYQTYTAQQQTPPENYALYLLASLAGTPEPQPIQEEEEETTATQHPNTQNLIPIKLTDQITGKTSYQCPLCNQKTLHKSNMVKHIFTHSKVKNFPCPLCCHAASRQFDLDTHIHSQHPNEKPYACILCGFTTAKFSELKEHN